MGRVPAVVYGKDLDPMALTVNSHEAIRLFESISTENTIVSLAIEGEEPMDTLVREIQSHPFRRELVHVDFYQIQKGVEVELDIPVILVGTADGVRHDEGIMEQVLHEVRVKCIPSLIPSSFELEVTSLNVGDSLHVSDIKVAEGVELLTELERTVCAVAVPRVIEEPEPEEGLEEGMELAEGEEAPDGEATDEGPSDGDGSADSEG